MRFKGSIFFRLEAAWAEVRENMGRSLLQTLGIMLGVASVLAGFSITDSQVRRADEYFVKAGGLDKLNVYPSQSIKQGAPSALQNANLGLRQEDAREGQAVQSAKVDTMSVQRNARARIRSEAADQERRVLGAGMDFMGTEGYMISQGRYLTEQDLHTAAPVAILGYETAQTFFPGGEPLNQTLRVGDIPVKVVGVFQERVFRFRKNQKHNAFWRQNRVVVVPASLVQRRMNGDLHERVDRVTFKLPDINTMNAFADSLKSVLFANHRQQEDFRLDDVAARVKRMREQGVIYNVIFMLSGILALLGGGMVNVNIQLASLKERVREVGVKMAIGAGGAEIFKEFMTEALLLTLLGSVIGLAAGVAFSAFIMGMLGVPLYLRPASFIWALAISLFFGLLFALYPARKASRLSPMEALRYE